MSATPIASAYPAGQHIYHVVYRHTHTVATTQCHRRSHRSSTTARAPPHTVTIATALLSPEHNVAATNVVAAALPPSRSLSGATCAATARAHGLGTHLQGVVAVCNLLPDELVGGSGKVARKELYELVRHVLDKVEASLAVALHHEHGKVAAARVSERKTTIGVGWKDHS